MKSFKIHSFLRFSRIALQAVALVVALSVFGAGMVVARETYVDYAARILAAPPEGAAVRADLEAAVLRATNAYRASKKLPPLKPVGGALLTGARAQAMDLLLQGGMGHVSSTGHGFAARIRALHLGQMVLAPMAENAARLRNSQLSDAEKAAALVTQWIKSAGHRKNLSDRTYVMVAIGVVTRGDDIYAVQIFSGPLVKTNFGRASP